MSFVRPSTSRPVSFSGLGQSNSSQLVKKKGKNSPESRLIFVLGGARSGKSSFALQLGKAKAPRAFLATAEPLDREMAQRIHSHQKSRGRGWATYEIPVHLADWFSSHRGNYSGVVVDCLTLWLNNLLRDKVQTRHIPSRIRKLLKTMRTCPAHVVLVSNELGLGLVPADAMSRTFRDAAGRMNQLIAEEADEVYFLVSGIPLRVK